MFDLWKTGLFSRIGNALLSHIMLYYFRAYGLFDAKMTLTSGNFYKKYQVPVTTALTITNLFK